MVTNGHVWEMSEESMTVGMCNRGVCNGGQYMQKRSAECMMVSRMCRRQHGSF